MRYVISLAPQAIEDLRRLSAYHRAAVRDHIETHLRFAPNATSKSSIKRLQNIRWPQYRLRVAQYRVFYDVTDDRVEIIAIVAKEDMHKWLHEFARFEK